jgi:ABC-type dipeptide/oligopeptide/nickel transport system permease subunit
MPSAASSAAPIAARSPLQLFWGRLRRDRVAMVALGFIGLVILIAIFAPLIVKVFGLQDPNFANDDALNDFGSPSGPSGAHPFGVDDRGRDVLSRVLYGARVSMLVAVIATAVTMVIGTIVGLLAGFYRGKLDALLSRVTELTLAFPTILLGIGLSISCADGCKIGPGPVSFVLQPGLWVVVIVISLTAWPYVARLVRGQVLSLREKEFVDAARSLGASDRRIIVREILPNLTAPLIVYATVLIPQNILAEAALSFLGVGVDPSTPSWGAMISSAIDIFDTAWWFMLFPGIALLLAVLAFNIVGDGLQDAINPRTGRSGK